MDQITQFLIKNKRPLIQISGAVAGAVVGLVVIALVMSVSDEEVVWEDEDLE